MLDVSLIAKTAGKADDGNVVFWKDYRVTVLFDRLFRIEKSAAKKYRDSATQTVWFRNMPKCKFKVSLFEDKAEISTDKCTLILDEDREKCAIISDGKRVKLNNDKNLKGTCRTLDKCDGDDCYVGLFDGDRKTKVKVQLDDGVCSLNGVAVLNDGESLTLSDSGVVLPEKADGSDEYVFAYGDDYRGAVKAFLKISGNIPMIPRYALGNWWSRYHAYTDKEYIALMNKFKDENIPLTVATVDMDWHYSDNVVKEKNIDLKYNNSFNSHYPIGWTGYSWNVNLFPDHKKFLQTLHEMNLHVSLNEHPADGVRYWEDAYEEMATAMGIDPKTKQAVLFDIADEKFIDNYFDILHTPEEKDGVDFWWIDWQQGTNTKMENLDPLWSLNHYHYLHASQNKGNALILSRYAGIGSHRYPLGFSGDTFVSWKTLQFLPYFTATASNIAYSWWSHDIGGHLLGEQDGELYLRHIQFGVFSPINRLHCCNSPSTTKEPCVYKNGVGGIVADWLRLRHKMIPFLYSADYRCYSNAEQLIEPLYYEYKTSAAYKMKNEYIFGKNLLVAPVTEHTKNDGYARVKVWLPQGVWTDVFTQDVYSVSDKNGKVMTMLRNLDSIPVLAKSGTIFPLSLDEGNSVSNPEKMQINVYFGNGEFSLYEGDEDASCITGFNLSYAEENGRCTQNLTIKPSGDLSVLPQKRSFTFNFINIFDPAAVVYVNDKAVEDFDSADDLTFTLSINAGDSLSIKVEYKKADEVSFCIKKALKILQQSNGNYEQKDLLYFAMEKAKDKKEIIDLIESSGVRAEVKTKLKEIL